MRNIYRILALSCACFSFVSCAKSSNTIKTSLIIPSGAPTLAAYKILTNSDAFDAEVRSDATTIPAEFSLGNANFIVFDSINGSNILSKQCENAKYEYVKMLTGGNFHLLAFNKDTIDIKDEDVVYGFMSNSTPGKLFRAIYGEIGFDQNFDGVSGVRDSLLQMNENYEVNGVKVDYAVVAEPVSTAIKSKLSAKNLKITDINLQSKFNEVKEEWKLDYICQAGLFVNKEFKNSNPNEYSAFMNDISAGISSLFTSLDTVIATFEEKFEDDASFTAKFGFAKTLVKGVQGENSSKNGFGIVPNKVEIRVEDITTFSSLL